MGQKSLVCEVTQPHNQRGSALLLVLFAVVIIGLTAGLAGRTWSSVMQQVREDELLFRGDQYRRAIESYYQSAHGGMQGQYPAKLEDLLKDPRTLSPLRHLRQLYLDPFTNEEFELVLAGGNVGGTIGTAQSLGKIKGVRSKSRLAPFKQDGFAVEYEKFKGKKAYSEWEFVFEPTKVQPAAGASNPQGQIPRQKGSAPLVPSPD